MGLDKYSVGSLWMTRDGGKAIILNRSFETDQVLVYHYGAGAPLQHNADGICVDGLSANSAYNLAAPWADAIQEEMLGWAKNATAICQEMCSIMSEGRKVTQVDSVTFDGETYRATNQEYGRRIEIKRGTDVGPILQEEALRYAKEMNDAGVDTIIWRTPPKFEVVIDDTTGARTLRVFWCVSCLRGDKQIAITPSTMKAA